MRQELYIDPIFDNFIFHHDSGLISFRIQIVKLPIREHQESMVGLKHPQHILGLNLVTKYRLVKDILILRPQNRFELVFELVIHLSTILYYC